MSALRTASGLLAAFLLLAASARAEDAAGRAFVEQELQPTDVLVGERVDVADGVELRAAGALHHREHPAHMNLNEALAFAAELAAEHTWLTHISHHMGKVADVAPQLPPNVSLAHDGLEISF